jgi:hypothetical protein
MTTEMMESCTIVNPVGRQGREPVEIVDALASLEGARVAVLDISKVRSDAFADVVQAALRDRGALTERGIAPPSQRLSDDDLSAIGARCDAAVLALADCGTCTSWTMFDAIELHRHGCRAVLVTTSALRPTVTALAGRLGMAELPVVEVDQPNRDQSVPEIAATALAAMPAVVDQLVAA